MKQRLSGHEGGGARDERAREWKRTAFIAWGGAIAAALWSRLVDGAHTGDVVLAAYLAFLGTGLWVQAVRVRLASRVPRFTPALANVLAIALAAALVLGIADLVSNGRF